MCICNGKNDMNEVGQSGAGNPVQTAATGLRIRERARELTNVGITQPVPNVHFQLKWSLGEGRSIKLAKLPAVMAEPVNGSIASIHDGIAAGDECTAGAISRADSRDVIQRGSKTAIGRSDRLAIPPQPSACASTI